MLDLVEWLLTLLLVLLVYLYLCPLRIKALFPYFFARSPESRMVFPSGSVTIAKHILAATS